MLRDGGAACSAPRKGAFSHSQVAQMAFEYDTEVALR